MLAVNVREFKARLSRYLREVKAGEVVLVTDRGKVVAELRRPLHDERALGRGPGLVLMAEKGLAALGLPHDPSLYRRPPVALLPTEVIDEALDWIRGDR
ncbi:MAG: type II toxin-antitoxin system prevent-host-death family antitoxin [Myxococcota bacterium]